MMKITDSSVLIGAAGEHYVLAELIKRGVIAAKAPEGSPNMDIVTTDLSGEKLVALQVKTRRERGGDKGWHMKDKHDNLVSDNLFYVFVDLGSDANQVPTYFIVPSAEVASAVRGSHAAWLRQPGKKGQPHNDSKMRRFQPAYASRKWDGITPEDDGFLNSHQLGWLDQYKNAWHLTTDKPLSRK